MYDIRFIAVIVCLLVVGDCGGDPSLPAPADVQERAPTGDEGDVSSFDTSHEPDVPVVDSLDVTPPIDLPSIDVPPIDLPDASIDVPSVDLPEPTDVATDVPADVLADVPDTSGRCSDDTACERSSDGPVCDLATHRCVPCTPTNDRCPADQHCISGMNRCAPGCRDDLGCRSTESDGGTVLRHCDTGAHVCVDCMSDGHCPAGTLCVGSACVPGCSATRPCSAGQSCCGGRCIDTQTNTAHCGGCDQRCSIPNAMPICRSGTCGLESCVAPFGNCDGNEGNGCETDLRLSMPSCGACGSPCTARPNSTARCEAGTCRYTCTGSFGDCDGNAVNGCETDLGTTPDHCGMCGRVCTLPNATAGCNLGACTVASCSVGFGDCNTNPADGCEVDLRTNLTHCGGCGRRCSPSRAYPTCTAGLCRLVGCDVGYGDCDRDVANGCEVALTGLAHCGACGITCPAPAGPHTVARCNPTDPVDVCGLACEPGWRDCDGNLANGCETTGACFTERTLFADELESVPTRWSGTDHFGYTSSGNCRNIRRCFGCDHCFVTGALFGSCDNEGTATLSDEFDFSLVVGGTFTFYSVGSGGSTDTTTLQVSTDGGASWTSLPTASPYAGIPEYAPPVNVDLAPVALARRVRFRFLWIDRCDARNAWNWAVDDITISVRERAY